MSIATKTESRSPTYWPAMSKDSIRNRIDELENNDVDTADMAVFGYINDGGQLVDEHGKPIETAMFGVKRSHK